MTDIPMSFEKLKDFLGYERPSDIIKWLEINAIPYKLCMKKPVTTMSAINKAIIGEEDEDFDFDFDV